jgi:serine/threonine-protein kinase
MRALATEPADRFATAEAFGAALAGAGATAWGEGWLSAEQVPIMDAGPISGTAGRATATRRQDVPTTVPAGPEAVTGEAVFPPPPGPAQHNGSLAAAAQAPAATAARSPADRRKLIITGLVAAVVLIAIIVVLVFAHPFSVYRS